MQLTHAQTGNAPESAGFQYRYIRLVQVRLHALCSPGSGEVFTQFRLAESTPAFSGFGGPKAMVESSVGGENIFNEIGINTGGYNYRAVGVKWMDGADSYLNDVKFVGGHGGMSKPQPQADRQLQAAGRNTITRRRASVHPTTPLQPRVWTWPGITSTGASG
jgi:hypothetical protein